MYVPMLLAAHLGLLGALLATGPGAADTFVLKDGGQVVGTLVNPDENPRRSYVIELEMGGRLTLEAAQVDHVEAAIADSEALRRYQEFLAGMPDTLEAHWDLAERCKKARLKDQRELHLQKVLEFDPHHEGARHALGFSRVGNRWVRVDEWMQSQGYVRHRGDWKLPQEVAMETASEQREQEIIQWRTDIRRWRSWLVKGKGREQEALEKLNAIDSSRAVPAISELLAEKDEPKQLKILYLELLAKLESGAAVEACIRTYLRDADPDIRDKCLEILAQSDSPRAVIAFTGLLKSKDNALVNHAASALGHLQDATAIPALIEALVTKHKYQIQTGGGNLSTGFSPTGGGGLTAGGGGPQTIEQERRNERVLEALMALVPEGTDNHSFDEEAWRAWLVRSRVPAQLNLRRD